MPRQRSPRPAARRPAASRRIQPLGDTAVLVELGSKVDTALNSRALALAAALRARRGVKEAQAGYASVLAHYDPEQVTYRALEGAIGRLLKNRPPALVLGRLHRIPVMYDGPDLADVAAAVGLSPERVIELHTRPIYRVFMIGFCPGWSYLGPLPEGLRLPRRSVPRTAVLAGSVAIAGDQTGVYPLVTPGGWHLIGKTRLPVFLPDSYPPALLRPGDRVKFFAA
jgi:KipI family sensor histidine kinase inhibitor